jgi:hypothetical protein
MKSLTRFLAIVGILFCSALSCPANATNTEETKTFVDTDLSDITFEVADFNRVVVNQAPLVKFNDSGVIQDLYEAKVQKHYGSKVSSLVDLNIIKIKRFPLPRSGLT